MFQNHFESQDPSTLNLSQCSGTEQVKCKAECNSVLIFIILGFVFLIMGMVELLTNYQDLSYILPLTQDIINNKITSSTTYVTFKQDERVFIYLNFKKLTQFSYANKFDGEKIQYFDLNADNCNAFKLNKQTNKKISFTNNTLSSDSFSIPCGRFPSMFIGNGINLILGNETVLPLDYNGSNVFDYSVNDIKPTEQWISLQNPLFQNWLEQNVAINTHKLTGIVEGRFQGLISLQIILSNGFPQSFGDMYAHVTNNKALGGSDPSFCFMNFIQSSFMFIFALIVYLYHRTMIQEVRSANAVADRKIQLRSNYQGQVGKQNEL